MVRWQAAVGAVLIGLALHLPLPARSGSGAGPGWQWPLAPTPRVTAAFHAPAQRWGPGHRGVDLLASVGQQVLAIGDGTIAFAGMVAGRGVVVVDHGELRSTYEPVTPRVSRGEPVRAGQVIATLAAVGSHCPPAACLHLGVRRGDAYLDPLSLLGPQQVRLKPLVDRDPTASTTNSLGGVGPGSGIGGGSGHRGSPPPQRWTPSALAVTASAGGATAAGLAALSLVRRRRRRLVRV
jgi:Peptidase family M23